MSKDEFNKSLIALFQQAADEKILSHFIVLYREEGTTVTTTISDAPEGADIARALSSWVTTYLAARGTNETEVYENGKRIYEN